MSEAERTEETWVISRAYEGPNRRRRAAWFKPKARLDDVNPGIDASAESIDTLLRRVSLWGSLVGAARERRAAFVTTLEALAEKGRAAKNPVWPELVAACARYVRAVGADGKIDEPLVTEALLATQRAHAENGHGAKPTDVLVRLDAAARRG